MLYLVWVLVPTANLVFTTFKLPKEVMTSNCTFPGSGGKTHWDIWKIVPWPAILRTH